MEPSRVGFFGRHEFYRNILAPVRDALDPDVESLLTGDLGAMVRFRPHVLLLASHDRLEAFRHYLPTTQIGTVRHGLVSKLVLLRTPRRPAARTYDFLCAGPDDTALELFARAGAPPVEVWRTGYPQLDPLHRRDAPAVLPLDPGRPTVLFAPTWNLGLSAAGMLGDRLVGLVRAGAPGANIVIKPHPMVGSWRPDWMRTWRRLARQERNVQLVADTHTDITPFMLAADLMVSDASSVIFEFLALDRPMVLVTNPEARADPAYDPDDIIWRWRDVGAEVHRIADLPTVIAAELEHPARRHEQRASRAEALFAGQTDGGNARRVAARLSARSRELAAATAGVTVGGRVPWSRWVIEDAARAIWQQPRIRRLVIGPLERRRLSRRTQALHVGRLRTPDGRPIPAPEPAGQLGEHPGVRR